MVVGPAPISHVTDLYLHIVVDLGATPVLSALQFGFVFLVVEQAINLGSTHAV